MQLTVNEISKSFGEVKALRGVSFTATAGEPFGLLGRNGAGKTTSMRIIMGIFPADGGEVLVDGKPISKSGVKIGYLPEERGLYRKSKVGEQLTYFARLRGLSQSKAKSSVEQWLERLGMSEYRNSAVETLSKGNQQRIQLALALINDPEIVILDEPFSGLDPVNANQLKEIVREQAQKGKIILFSSHQMATVEDFCNDIAIINKGELALNGTLSEIRKGYPRNTIIVETEGGMRDIESGALSSAVERFGAVQCGNGSAQVTLNGEATSGELLRALLDSGMSISKFEVAEPSLEEIFVSTVEGAAQ